MGSTFRGAADRDETGGKRNSDKEQGERSERGRIGRSYPVKQAGQNTRARQCKTEAGRDAQQRKRETLPQDAPRRRWRLRQGSYLTSAGHI
jgi:hypothetical protein